MSWIIIAALSAASSVFILMLANIYLYYRYRQKFVKLWAIAWGIHVLRYLCMVVSALWKTSLIPTVVYHLCVVVSAAVLVGGTRNFIGRPQARWLNITGAIIIPWTIGALFLGMPLMTVVIPVFAFLSFSYILIGSQILKQSRQGELASRITGGLFIVWGVHQADYPWLRSIDWFAPWGFLLGSILATSSAIGMILIYLERNQNDLQAKEERYSNMIKTSQNRIWEVDADGVYTYASHHVYELLGYTPEEVLGKTLFDLMPEDEASRIREIFMETSSRRESFHRLENTNLHKDGSLVVLETNAAPHFDSQGNYLGYRGMDQNITERKQAEIDQKTAGDVLRILNESTDLQNMIHLVIAALKERTGFDAVGIRLQKGEDYPYFMHEGFSRDFLQKENSLLGHTSEGRVYRNKCDDVNLECICGRVVSGRTDPGNPLFTQGGSFWTSDSLALAEMPAEEGLRTHYRYECIYQGYASIALVPIRHKDRILGLLQFNDKRKGRFSSNTVARLEGIASHIGEALMRKQAEEERLSLEKQFQQSQKMESVGILAGGVAHDFNNKLTVILGQAFLALSNRDMPKIFHRHLEEICKAAEQSADLTRQLLAFARKQVIVPKVLDLNETVASMLKMLQRLIGEDIQLMWHPAPDLWPLKFDPSQIDQILANLCVNARDSISGGGRITIETKNCRLDEHNCFVGGEYEYVLLSLSDNGCGMDKETQSHIFEPFFTTKEVGKGTGLGLAMVFGIVKQNNGFINVYSEPSLGTTFTIYLPRYLGEVGQKNTGVSAMPVPRGLETILLVEDEFAILNVTADLLAKQGYSVLQSITPSEAIRLAREHVDEIVLLITDVVMPEMTGKELAGNLKNINPQLKCLYMSGYTADVIAEHGVLEEDINFIQKPFSLPDLATKVRQVLDGKNGCA